MTNTTITLFVDIDGTLINHIGNASEQLLNPDPQIVSNSLDALNNWSRKGYLILLTTARKPSMRDITVKQLDSIGIIYDQLIMGLSNIRILINDCKNEQRTAYSVNLKRNAGLKFYDFNMSNLVLDPNSLLSSPTNTLLSFNSNFIIRQITLNENDIHEEHLDIVDKSYYIISGEIDIHIYASSHNDLKLFRSSNEHLDNFSIMHSPSCNEITKKLYSNSIINFPPLAKFKLVAAKNTILLETSST